jgi:diadenosine tetraphosphate (Ap4A) HIT family hydrolase
MDKQVYKPQYELSQALDEASFAKGDNLPLEIPHLETAALARTKDGNHLERMAQDEDYLREQLDILAEKDNFLISTKAASYTKMAPDVMGILAHTSGKIPRDIYELNPKDLKNALHLAQELRQSMQRTVPNDRDKVFIGIAGGITQSIPRFHFHVYSLGEYEPIATKEAPAVYDAKTADISQANQDLGRALQDRGLDARYDNFSMTLKLPIDLASFDAQAKIKKASEMAAYIAKSNFGAKGGYGLSINSDNILRIAVIDRKRGPVEAEGYFLLRSVEADPQLEEEVNAKRQLNDEIVQAAII